MTFEQAKVDPVLQVDGSGGVSSAAGNPGDSLGSALRKLREARGWSLGDVSARLKFSVRQLESLEADRWDELPQGPSLRGLVRNYARMLDAPADALLQALPAHLLPAAGHPSKLSHVEAVNAELPSGTTLPGVHGSGRRGGWAWLVFVVLMIAVLGLAAYLFFSWWLPRSQGLETAPVVSLPFASEGQVAAELPLEVGNVVVPVPTTKPVVEVVPTPATSNVAETTTSVVKPLSAAPASLPAHSATPAAPATSPVAPAPLSAPVTVPVAPARSLTGPFVVPGITPAEPVEPAAPAVPSPPPIPANRIGFDVTGASWVEVRDANGSVAFSATLQPGDQRHIDVSPPARVVIGNAGGVRLSWGGKAVDLAGHQRGNVARLTLE